MQTELTYDTVFDAQLHFRLLLDSMSRPGKINRLDGEIHPPEGLSRAAALTGFALFNADVSYHITSPNADDIARYLLVNTASAQTDIAEADFVFLPEDHDGSGLDQARMGTAVYPENSTTIIAAAELISSEHFEDTLSVKLTGPGVNGERMIYLKGISHGLLAFIKEQNTEYPLGIDLIIADRDGRVIGIPRSNQFSFTQNHH